MDYDPDLVQTHSSDESHDSASESKPATQPPAVQGSSVSGKPKNIVKYWSLPQSEKKRLLGSSEVVVRSKLRVRKWKSRTFYVHKSILPRWDYATAVIDDYEKRHGVNYKLHSTWSFCWRKVRGGVTLSNHSFGIAFDFNPAQNPMKLGKLVTDIPPYFINAFKSVGCRWGGDYKTRKDAMHIEF